MILTVLYMLLVSDCVTKGEQNILTSEKPLQLGVTSGTSGSSHLLVFTKKSSAAFFMKGIVSVFEVMFRSFPKVRKRRMNAKSFTFYIKVSLISSAFLL